MPNPFDDIAVIQRSAQRIAKLDPTLYTNFSDVVKELKDEVRLINSRLDNLKGMNNE